LTHTASVADVARSWNALTKSGEARSKSISTDVRRLTTLSQRHRRHCEQHTSTHMDQPAISAA